MKKLFLFAAMLIASALGSDLFAQLDATKTYTIANNNDANMFMQDNGTGGVDLGAENENSYWKFFPTSNTDCYYIQNTVTGKYIQGYTATEQEVATGDTGVEYCVKADASGSYSGKYRMSCTANSPYDFSDGTLGLNWKDNNTVQSFASVAEGNPRSAWTLTEVEDPDPAHVHDYTNNGICTCDGDEKYQPAEMVDGVYMLGNVGNVEWMSAKVGAGAANEEGTPYAICSYKLTADIDYAGLPVNAHKPIGTFDKKFLGVFDGDGHTIKNMKLDQPERPRPGDDGIGFFGCVRVGNDAIANVVIKNLTIDSSCEVKGSSAYVAGIVGRIHERTQNNTLLIENCVNKANVTTTANHVAGIVGQITAINDRNVTITIKNCTNEGAITTSEAYAAGIVAQINSAAASTVNIFGCTNKGAVQTVGLCAAGIVSQANNCAVALNIESCMNFANVTSTGNKNCGGIHGANTSSKATIRMINCGNTGNVSATTESAALTGWIGSNSGNIITNCWNIGSVTGISNSDNTYRGTVTVTNVYDKNGGQGAVITDEMLTSGELCYRLNGDQSEIAWTQTLDGTQEYPLPVADGAQVYAHGQLYCDGTSAPGTLYNNEGPDGIVQIPHDISDEIGMCTFCHTQFQEPTLVDGWYELKNAGNVEWFGASVAAGNTTINGKLMNDIDFLNIENLHSPIGPNTGKKYNGIFDGQGFRIKNMIIERPSDSNIGFFGFLRGNGTTTIMNLIMDKSCTIHGYNRIGGITGSYQVEGGTITIENVINEATITAEHQDAGGIFGGHEGGNPTIIIKNVLNTGTITAKNSAPYAGALCCYLGVGAGSKIENFVNLGKVNGHNGGNIGRHNIGDVTNLIDLSDTDDKTQGNNSGLNTTDIAGGKLAYTVGWWQLLGTDAYPMPFAKEGAVVYQNGNYSCPNTVESLAYSNTENITGNFTSHTNNTKGFCTYCDEVIPDHISPDADNFLHLSSSDDLVWFSAMVNAGNTTINGKLTADVDMSSVTYTPIGNGANRYQGTFDGSGHKVNLNVDANAYGQGFISIATGGVTVKNLVVTGSVKNADSKTAGIIAEAIGGGVVTIQNCGNEATIQGNSGETAAIVANNWGYQCTLNIENVYNIGDVSGSGDVSTICACQGNSSSVFKNVYNSGSVTGATQGNFVRTSNGTYTNCYSTTLSDSDNASIISTDASKVTSGELCAKLGFGFRQNLSSDAYPNLASDHGFVAQIGAAGYSTMYNVYSDVEIPSGIEAYAGVVNGTSLSLVAIENKIAASEPVVLKLAEGTDAGLFNFMPTTGASKAASNSLSGSNGSVTGREGIYALAQKGDPAVVGFYPVAASVTIPEGKAYLEYTGSNPIKVFTFEDDATAIEIVNGQSSMVNGPIFNLAGQRINKMQKGINIVNGKKIAVK